MNFDSDYGDKNFADKNAYRHDEVAENLISECNAIKSELRISTHKRPTWDIKFLTSIGFEVKCIEDISAQVQKNKKLNYDSEPLFAIFAKKNWQSLITTDNQL